MDADGHCSFSVYYACGTYLWSLSFSVTVSGCALTFTRYLLQLVTNKYNGRFFEVCKPEPPQHHLSLACWTEGLFYYWNTNILKAVCESERRSFLALLAWQEWKWLWNVLLKSNRLLIQSLGMSQLVTCLCSEQGAWPLQLHLIFNLVGSFRANNVMGHCCQGCNNLWLNRHHYPPPPPVLR